MSSNLSEKIQQVIVHENRNFEKVITDVADGFNRCGFFNEVPDWKNTLIQCFDRKRLGLPSGDIRSNTTVHTSVLSEDSFRRGLAAQSTPLVAGRTNAQTLRNKRPPTLPDDGGQREAASTPKRAKTSLNEMEAARILVDLRRTDWERILPPVNEGQNAARYENVFEKSRRLIGLATPFRNRRTDDIIATQMSMLPDRNPADIAATQTSTLPDRNPATPNNPITKRRNAVFISAVKHSMVPVPVVQRKTTLVTQPVSTESNLVVRRKTAPATKTGPKGSKKAKSTNVNPSAPTNPADNGVLTNITNRRLTRKQTHLLAAYSGTNANLGLAASISDRRGTGYFKRTSVLFTMVDAAQYKRILQTYNIFVADNNEKYDYVITERICRSPKFLSAVVSGKPILSLEWLHAMDEKKIWLDPLTYLLKDDEGEKEYGFILSDTLLKATNKRLFENYSILVTTHTKISPESLKDVIFSGGGKFLKTTLVPRRGDECICISDEVDKRTWPTLLRKYPTLKKIISLDGFSKMIFRYTHDVSPTDILHQI